MEFPLHKEETDVTPIALERIGAHSHIRGLGLSDQFYPVSKGSQGLFGQEKARHALGIVKKMIMNGNIAGRAILLAGPPGTGKTALAHALSQSLGDKTPFTSLTGSEVFSLEMNKTEALTQALRRSIAVRVHEVTEVIQGEVVSVEMNPPNGETSQSSGTITLKTTDMESVFNIGHRLSEQIKRLNIQDGDVISLDLGTDFITKLGVSFSRIDEYDIHASSLKHVHTPDGELRSRKETVHVLSLHELDVVNSRNQGFLALFAGDTGEIKQEVRDSVNAQVAKWQDEKRAELIPGVLFIDEVHMLDLECFSFLNRAIENENAPIIIMASNRGYTKIRGTNEISPHGIPRDLLQRMTIIPTMKYKKEEMKRILMLRAAEEDVTLKDESLELLTVLAKTYSLRYAMQLITTSSLIAERYDHKKVKFSDVERANQLFIDKSRSMKYLIDLASV